MKELGLCDNPQVTIIILTYCKFDNLTKNLESVFCQTYYPIEVIIQDDGSENFNEKYLTEQVQKIDQGKKNVVKISIESNSTNLGTVKNYNTALRKSNGKYIIPLSQDDYFYDENCVADIVEEFETSKCLALSSKRIGNETREVYPRPEEQIVFDSCDGISILRELYDNVISGSVLCFDREIFERIGEFDEKYCLLEDYPYAIKLLRNGFKIHFFNRITICYNEDGISRKKLPSRKLYQDQCRVYTEEILPLIESTQSRFLNRLFRYRYNKYKYIFQPFRRCVFQLFFIDCVLFGIYTHIIAKRKRKKADDIKIQYIFKKYNEIQKKTGNNLASVG